MDIREKLENQALFEGLLIHFFESGIINSEEFEELQSKIAIRNNISPNGMIIKKMLINKESNESIQTQKDTK